MRRALTLHDRVVAYGRSACGQRWPDSVPYVSPTGRWLYGHWTIGALFSNLTRYPGAYPRTYLERVRALFPEIPGRATLHAFAGAVPKGPWTRLDIKPKPWPGVRPELVGHVYDLPALIAARRRGPFRLIFVDPPYTKTDAIERYGTAPIDKARVMRTFAAVLAPGGFVVWLDLGVPMFRRDQWHWFGDISLYRSTNQFKRTVSIFERRAAA